MKQLSVDTHKPLGRLLEEAIAEVLKKYDKSPSKPSK
jgi:hypothetical protein